MLICLTENLVINTEGICRIESYGDGEFCCCGEYGCRCGSSKIANIYMKDGCSITIESATAREVFMAIENRTSIEEQKSIEKLAEKGM